MKLISPLSIFLSLIPAMARADVSSFSTPPKSDDPNSLDFSNNQVYSMDDSITVQWTTSFQNVTMLLEQKDNNFRPVLIDNELNPSSMSWTVSYNDFKGQLNGNGMMRFLLYQAPTQNHVYSHFFNLSSLPDVASTSTAPQMTSTPVVLNQITISSTTSQTPTTLATTTGARASASLTASPASVSPNQASSTSSAASASPSSHGLDASTQAGLGVGLGVGIPLLGLLAGIIYLLVRRRNQENQRQHQGWPGHADGGNGGPYHSMSTSLSTTSPQTRGFAIQPEMHAVPIMQAPPPRYIAHNPSSEKEGYAPPSAHLKPFPDIPLHDEEVAIEPRRMDAYGRPQGPLHEAPGDYASYVREGPGAPGAMGPYMEPKELPALPLTPSTPTRRQREVRAEEEEQRLRKLLSSG